jgi:predicted enzyme related to lactoylglutathione lyase
LARARLTRVILMVRSDGASLAKATEFYHSALGLQVLRVTDDWAELQDENRLSISLQAVPTEPQVSTGYSPILSFQVHDMDTTIAKCVQMGGHLDGPIQYPAHGKVAALRSPDGHMIGLYEAAIDGSSTQNR